MSGVEGIVVAAWLHDTLTTDPVMGSLISGVFDTLAPPEAAAPFVVFSEATPPADTNGVGGVRVLVRGAWQVRVTVEGMSWAPAIAAVERMDQLLQGALNLEIVGCVRQSAVKIAETTAQGQHYRHLGGIYDITVG